MNNVYIHPTATIDVRDLVIGEGTHIGAYSKIEGHKVHLGRDSWIGDRSLIGGGSSHDPNAFLETGDFFHLGVCAEVNTARGVTIGHEVGLGVQTRVFTHGAYLSALDGFPADFAGVTIGNRVWIPNGQINPGTVLGNDIVAVPGTVINGGSWDSGSLIGGNPATVLKQSRYPSEISPHERSALLDEIVEGIELRAGEGTCAVSWPLLLVDSDAAFNLSDRTIAGKVTKSSEVARHQLRRYGIRFRFRPIDGIYVPWEVADQ